MDGSPKKGVVKQTGVVKKGDERTRTFAIEIQNSPML